MVYVYSLLYLSVFVDYLVVIGDLTNAERALPPWRQLRSAVRRGSHGKDETSFLVWVGDRGRNGEAICWWVSCNHWVIASTYSEGSSTAGDA